MKAKGYRFSLVATALGLLAAACAPAATPVVVENTVEVPVTQIVEVPVEVTAPPDPTAAPEPVTLTYFTFSAAPDHLDHLDAMIAAFEATHPNVTIEVETAPFNEYFTKLQTLIAGGTAPDIFELNYENFVSYASKGVLLDLSSQSAGDASFAADVYYPRAYDAFSLNGMQLGLPATFSTVGMFYNKDLFDQAGLDYPTSDWTWADAVAAGQQINDPAAGVYGLYSPTQFWEFYKKAAQNDCEFFNADKTEATINSPQCVEALQTMVNFVQTDKVMPSDADMGGVSDGDLFKSGKLGMIVTGIWMFSAFQDAGFEWDIVVEPGLKNQATHFFANGVSVFAATQHPQEAWEWAKFFTSSPEAATIRVEAGWELPAVSDTAVFDSYLQQTPPANRQAVLDSLNFAIVPPVIERQSEMQDAVNKLLDQVKLGQLTPQEALDQAKLEIEALLK
ncbi:MAG TPA: sugar ABC transporter substrate-binding protein [Anaerolineales bacterium]|nr:sugar ABC transporter substrate-binding protein [Anaerolineales bacterium]